MSELAITYSPRIYAFAALASTLVGVALLVIGYVAGPGVLLLAGAAAVVFGLGFGYGTRERILGRSTPALDRDGDLLVGVALPQPLVIADTSFETVKGFDGGWFIVLHSNGQRYRLAPGGWRVAGARWFTRAVAERALIALGLTPR